MSKLKIDTKALVEELKQAVRRLDSRVTEDNQILGWSGYLVDLEDIEDLAQQLRDAR